MVITISAHPIGRAGPRAQKHRPALQARPLTPTVTLLQRILDDCDKDDSGCIDFDEFKRGMKSYVEFLLHDD